MKRQNFWKKVAAKRKVAPIAKEVSMPWDEDRPLEVNKNAGRPNLSVNEVSMGGERVAHEGCGRIIRLADSKGQGKGHPFCKQCRVKVGRGVRQILHELEDQIFPRLRSAPADRQLYVDYTYMRNMESGIEIPDSLRKFKLGATGLRNQPPPPPEPRNPCEFTALAEQCRQPLEQGPRFERFSAGDADFWRWKDFSYRLGRAQVPEDTIRYVFDCLSEFVRYNWRAGMEEGPVSPGMKGLLIHKGKEALERAGNQVPYALTSQQEQWREAPVPHSSRCVGQACQSQLIGQWQELQGKLEQDIVQTIKQELYTKFYSEFAQQKKQNQDTDVPIPSPEEQAQMLEMMNLIESPPPDPELAPAAPGQEAKKDESGALAGCGCGTCREIRVKHAESKKKPVKKFEYK